jgi:hypothetical protein
MRPLILQKKKQLIYIINGFKIINSLIIHSCSIEKYQKEKLKGKANCTLIITQNLIINYEIILFFTYLS